MNVDTCDAICGKKVLIVYGGFLKRGGGVVTHIRNLKQLIEAMGAEVGIFSMENMPGPVAYCLVGVERALNKVAAPLGYLVRYALTRRLYERMVPKGYDIYIYEDIYSVPRKPDHIKFVTFVHALRSMQLHGLRTSERYLEQLKNWEKQLLVQFKQHLVTVSDEFSKRLESTTGVKPQVLHNFTAAESGHIPWHEKRDHVVIIGALCERKNTVFAVKVASELEKKGVRFKLSIYGDGPLRRQVEKLIAELNLEHCVELKGSVSHETILEALNEAKAVLIPSKEETFSYVALEAKASGCAVLATRGIDVPPDLVDITLPIDADAETQWAEAIERILAGEKDMHIKALPEKFTPAYASKKLCVIVDQQEVN